MPHKNYKIIYEASFIIHLDSNSSIGFPKDRYAKILVNEAKKFLQEHKDTSLEIVEFCIFDDLTLSYFKQEFDKLNSS